MSETVHHSGLLWRWAGADGSGSWHFVTLDGDAGNAIAAHEAMRRLELGAGAARNRGFGSVKVEARIGATCWRTSVFPSTAQGGYLLPVKQAVRRAEDLAEGDAVQVSLELL
ncbi:DUF1905 domain-containing protein [Altererythrobacter lauratis]|uniref:DUF1905 domain-containing protein n=1 Tax=Alteraurantiacibacter lauratis TaxID=2054627 RepID=A0ABV7EGZ0_9SPHN